MAPLERGIQQIVDAIPTAVAAVFSWKLPKSISIITIRQRQLQKAFITSSKLDWKWACHKRISAYLSKITEVSRLLYFVTVFLLCLLSLRLGLNNLKIVTVYMVGRLKHIAKVPAKRFVLHNINWSADSLIGRSINVIVPAIYWLLTRFWMFYKNPWLR